MLTTLARLAVAGPWQGGMLAGALSGLAVLPAGTPLLLPLVPVASVLGAGVVGLVVLERGGGAVAPLAAGALLAMLTGLIAGVGPAGAGALLGMTWLPVALLAGVLRRTRAFALTLVLAGGLALALLLLSSFGFDADALAARRAAFEQALGQLYPEDRTPAVQAAMELALRLAGGVFALTLLLLWCAALCLGRSMQARLRAPGAFAGEFRALRFGRAAALVTAAVAVLAAVEGLRGPALWAQVLLLAGGLMSLQGLAVLHAAVAARAVWAGTLWFAYATLLLAALQAGALFALLGVVDNWLDVRGRMARAQGG